MLLSPDSGHWVASIRASRGVIKFGKSLQMIQLIFRPLCSIETAEKLVKVLKTVKNEKRNGFGNVTLTVTMSIKYGKQHIGPLMHTGEFNKNISP